MPPRVAVAGVTNGLGHAIASAFLDTPDLKIILLSHFTSRGAVVKPVDYSSTLNLTSPLDGAETVISAMISSEPTINLISASKAARTRHFVPSEFALYAATNAQLALYEPK
ncbi:hypothetical protein D9756_005117 [Leucocoprinus leucothites]|uniref:Uncharacterized protein n=1 Tax=Leucocoprinus leucothites TaxID=201217 RepID=A0A8H5LKD8_9AGAR|nr:hypothetical protein D9756_005117 [Leucoagaricus leucothites]